MNKKLTIVMFILLVFILVACNNANNRRIESKKIKHEKILIGDVIPDWVYDNSISNDEFFDALNERYVIFYTDAFWCPNGRKMKKNIEKAIRKAGMSNKVVMKPISTSQHYFCHKYLSQIPKDVNVIDRVYSRQSSIPENNRIYIPITKNKYGFKTDNLYCIPRPENGKISENACSCSETYFVNICSNRNISYCIANTKEKRIIPMDSDDVNYIVQKLKEIKNNW